jgi:hypothetical protein
MSVLTKYSVPLVWLCGVLVLGGVYLGYQQATRQATGVWIKWNEAQFEAKHAECRAMDQEISRNSETQMYDCISLWPTGEVTGAPNCVVRWQRDATLPSDTIAEDVSITSGLVTIVSPLTPGTCSQVTSEGILRSVPSCGCEGSSEK